VPPAPGSYSLPPIQDAVDGAVVDADGTRRRLFDYLGDRLVLLSFVYTRCTDSEGCPLATGILEAVREEIAKDPRLGARVRLVTLSFDPERDRPEVMRRYALHSGPHYIQTPRNARPWAFLTTASARDLRPILDGYGQSIVREIDASGKPTGDFSHVLKVFLIDRRRRVRNIYSTSFLHPAMALADLRTLALEEAGTPLPGAGTDGFDRSALRRIQSPPLGLPPVPVPPANPPTIAAIRLGRKLFLDRRLSKNGTLSCAMCHVPEQGYALNETRTAVGFEGATLRRNAPTLLNAAYAGPFFHDGREPDLELQPFDVFARPDEMAAPSLGALVATIRSLPDYPPLFRAAYAGPPTVETIGRAIATYVRTLLSADSPFDRWRFGQADGAMSEAARRGFDLFTGKARCAACHSVGERHALFTDHRFHDTGIAWFDAMAGRTTREPVTVQLAPGEQASLPRSTIESVSGPRGNDLGRYEVTGDPADRWRIKTPSLRNVALTGPYMHDGSFATLLDVVMFYDRGAHPHEGLDPALAPLGLAGRDKDDLVAFLESLTGSGLDGLIRDTRSEPVGNPAAGDGRLE
jgi:cytochrome c peroxidase